MFTSRKLLNLCILIGVLNSIKSDEINCRFGTDPDWASDLPTYSCFATGLHVEVSDQTFNSVSGIHQLNKNISDVKHLGIRGSKILFMPKRFDLLFNLNSLLILGSSLIRVQSDDFIGLGNLEYLHLGDNMLNYLESDVFSRLSKLKILTLRDNYIEELPRDIFKYNLQLEELWIYSNNFKYINPTIFNHLTKLNHVAATGERHKCLKKNYTGTDKIIDLKEDIIKCANPNEVALTSDDLFKVFENCNINIPLFVKVVKNIQTEQKVETQIGIERSCNKFSTFFSLFVSM